MRDLRKDIHDNLQSEAAYAEHASSRERGKSRTIGGGAGGSAAVGHREGRVCRGKTGSGGSKQGHLQRVC